MPRPGPRRPQVAIRLDEATIARLDTLAEDREMSRSELIRLAIGMFLEWHSLTDGPT